MMMMMMMRLLGFISTHFGIILKTTERITITSFYFISKVNLKPKYYKYSPSAIY